MPSKYTESTFSFKLTIDCFHVTESQAGCPETLDYQECQRFLSPAIFTILAKLLVEAKVPEGDRVYCPYANCSALMDKSSLVIPEQVLNSLCWLTFECCCAWGILQLCFISTSSIKCWFLDVCINFSDISSWWHFLCLGVLLELHEASPRLVPSFVLFVPVIAEGAAFRSFPSSRFWDWYFVLNEFYLLACPFRVFAKFMFGFILPEFVSTSNEDGWAWSSSPLFEFKSEQINITINLAHDCLHSNNAYLFEVFANLLLFYFN